MLGIYRLYALLGLFLFVRSFSSLIKKPYNCGLDSSLGTSNTQLLNFYLSNYLVIKTQFFFWFYAP